MFNIGFVELIVVLLVAFLVVGPKDLPKVARWIARQIKSVRRIVRELKKETGWDDLAKEFRDVKEDVSSTMKDADISSELNSARRDVEDTLRSVQEDVRKAGEEVRQEMNYKD